MMKVVDEMLGSCLALRRLVLADLPMTDFLILVSQVGYYYHAPVEISQSWQQHMIVEYECGQIARRTLILYPTRA